MRRVNFRWRRVASLALVMVLLVCVCGPAYAAATETEGQTLRVGYIDYHGFIDREADGSYSGYGAEYLEKIAEYTGYQFEFVYGQWSDLLVMLADHKIDLLCNMQYTAERAEIYDFSAYPVGYTQGLLYTREDNDTLCYEDFSAFDGMTVGALRGNAMTELFRKYAAQHDFSCEIKEFDTDEALIAALEGEQLDAMCSEHLANHSGLSLLANFGADAYYIASYQDSPYLDEINFALQEIKTDVDFEADLFHKYYDDSSALSTVQFTTAEKAYIQAAEPIVVGLMTDRSPLSYAGEDGRPTGMMVEMMDLVAAKSGLTFEYRFMDIGQTGYDFLTNSGGDLVAGVAASAFSTPNPALLQSNTLLEASVVFVGRAGTEFSTGAALTVALPAGFINGAAVVSAAYPNFQFYNGVSNEDCLKAIRDGEADVMLQNIYIIRECLQSPLYDDLEIFPAYTFAEAEKVVALPENELLMSILNKAINVLTVEQSNDVVINNTIAKSYHASVGEIIYKYRWPLIGIAILLAAVLAMILTVAIIRQRNYLAMEKVNNRLEKTNLQLEDAVAQADRANTAKSQFLSRMSHEIRTPMNAIVGLTEIAKQHEESPEKIDDCLGKISVSSKVLLNIINDVLDMSAIESNKLKIAHEEFDLKQVLGGISTIYYPQCQNKGIQFEMATDVENEILNGDSLRVNQILMNLVSNAYKFTDAGGTIRILVRETARRDGKAFLRFTVADTGCGMTEDMKARLFKPFEQEAAGTARKHGGSGLGLSIAKNLVDLMQGAISVESEKGKGTTFIVDLPFDIEEKEPSGDDKALSSVHVLVVDDDEAAREYAAIVLQRIGATFDSAHSGAEALRMIRAATEAGRPYNVCLIDWKMPDMDGIEVTRRIRSQQGDQALIIIVSAYDLNEVQDEAKEAGADHFVSKPLFQSTVFNVLMTLTHGGLKTESAAPRQYDFTGHRVLLAEDQELNAEIAIELLGVVHMAADHAEDGEQVVQRFAAAAPGTYDAILMDVQMPKMDGYEATAAIRALDRADAKTIPIFAMTANAFTEDVSTALSAGMNGHIAKPIDTKVLYETLRKAVEHQL